MPHNGAEQTWRPACTLAALHARATMLQEIRAFFEARGVMEVETPIMARHGVTDVHLACIPAQLSPSAPGVGGPMWLQTSPEYHMKRLLAAGSGPIYQVFRAFRDAESGRRHNPEFSLLEWYRPGFDHWHLMDEVGALVASVAGVATPSVMTYREAFLQLAGFDPFEIAQEQLAAHVRTLAGLDLGGEPRDTLLDLVMTHQVEPALAELGAVFIHDYPASQAALARVHEDAQGNAVAHRFELYVNGLELCNGYWELVDADEQRRRFEADNQLREACGLPRMTLDQDLLDALRAGLPDCAGVALGLDRLLMVRTGAAHLDQVLAFPVARA